MDDSGRGVWGGRSWTSPVGRSPGDSGRGGDGGQIEEDCGRPRCCSSTPEQNLTIPVTVTVTRYNNDLRVRTTFYAQHNSANVDGLQLPLWTFMIQLDPIIHDSLSSADEHLLKYEGPHWPWWIGPLPERIIVPPGESLSADEYLNKYLEDDHCSSRRIALRR